MPPRSNVYKVKNYGKVNITIFQQKFFIKSLLTYYIDMRYIDEITKQIRNQIMDITTTTLKHENLREQLLETISTLPDGSRMPTVKTIMNKYNVSQSTVDKALGYLKTDIVGAKST